MFRDQVRITGTHAEIMKKYSRDKQGENKYTLLLNDNSGMQVESYIFETMYECYVLAACLGLAYNRKAESNTENNATANVFADKIVSNQRFLNRIFQQMVFCDDTCFGTDIDSKIKMLFDIGNMRPEDKKIGKDLFDSYVRGGLEIINETFKDANSYEDITRSLLKLVKNATVVEM